MDATEDRSERVAPALWLIEGRGMPLDRAIPWLAEIDLASTKPGLRILSLAARLVMGMLRRGDFGPADEGGVLTHTPHWDAKSIRCLSGLAELIPSSLLTARFAKPEEPVYAVTTRNFMVSLVGHALDACVDNHERKHENAERLPREFWRTPPTPVLSVIKPETELEDSVPWAIEVFFRPVPGIRNLSYSPEGLRDRLAQNLFPDPLSSEATEALEERMESLAQRLPALGRAISMVDGRASLNRKELDILFDHIPLLEGEGVEIELSGIEEIQRLAAQVKIDEPSSAREGERPWFEIKWTLALAGQEVSEEDFNKLANSKSPLIELDGGPVLIAPRDREALSSFAQRKKQGGQRIDMFEALRLKLGGAAHLHGLTLERIETGPILDKLAEGLERARTIEERPTPEGFVGELRPYQERGHAWMYYLLDQGFGACLADDMGLGKTIEAIAVILDWRHNPNRRGPILLVCPVSVLGNWRRELNKFSPELRVTLHHGKDRAHDAEGFGEVADSYDIILTSYNLLQRDQELFEGRVFEGLVLDEAQNIKNPTTQQSRAARALRGNFRMVLTGTPLENRPLDLWSIMDFLNAGLLGTRTSFTQTLEHPIVKQRSGTVASTLARLVRPFVLRRLKTDPEIITDLPEKSEQIVAATLSREQAVLYEAVAQKGLADVYDADAGIQRRGAILTTLLRLKQVCNHPAHYLSDGSPLPNRSGKFDLLMEMIEEALDEGDRCLVFTQFKVMGTLLKTYIESSLGHKTLFLHGSVPQKDREKMVNEFQESEEDGPKVFVLSLKAGGTGLNLTAANRVFHFDRWWNPAVEDQATDRAFRIGQQRNVFVHKFICPGTFEERIQEMLEQKRKVADRLLGAGEAWLSDLSNEDLRQLILLDREEALA